MDTFRLKCFQKLKLFLNFNALKLVFNFYPLICLPWDVLNFKVTDFVKTRCT